MRQVVLDTETTGLEAEQGHRILEIGCVEMIDRKITGRRFHQYINPEREVDEGALEVHGISSEFLADKPRFKTIWPEFFKFINGAELIIHNAAFDVAFINAEIALMDPGLEEITAHCGIIDSLHIARQRFPGQKNNLDALCRRFDVDNSQRDLHGALLDAEILADVYLLLTGGQVDLALDAGGEAGDQQSVGQINRLTVERRELKVIRATDEELVLHQSKLDEIEKKAGKTSVWRDKEASASGDLQTRS